MADHLGIAVNLSLHILLFLVSMSTLMVLILILLSIKHVKQSDDVRDRLAEFHLQLNSRLDQLLAAVAQQAHAEGLKQGREEERP